LDVLVAAGEILSAQEFVRRAVENELLRRAELLPPQPSDSEKKLAREARVR
jgi:hypothetical protein